MRISTLALSGLVSLVIGLAGFFRDRLISQNFGVSAETDLFFLALAWPLFISSVLASFSSSGFMPRFIRASQDGQKLAGEMICIHLGITSIFMMICLIFAAMSGVLLAKILILFLPIAVFTAFSTIWSAILQANRFYIFVSALQILPSLLAIIALLIHTNSLGIETVVYGTLCGYALLFLLSGIRVWWITGLVLPRWPKKNPDLMAILKQYSALAPGVLLMATQPLINQTMASFYGHGETSSLVLGGRVTGFILGLVATAISSIILGEVSRLYAQGDHSAFIKHIKLYEILLIGGGAILAIGIAIFSPQIINFIFASDKVTPEALRTINVVQLAYVAQIPFYLGGLIHVHVLSATERNHIITKIAASNFILNIILNVILGHFYGAIGIAVATSLVYCHSYIRLKIYMIRHPLPQLIREE